MTISVTLTWAEVNLAANVGILRRLSALQDRRRGAHGADDEYAWERDINGTIAELAVAKWCGVFWSGTIGRIDTADVGKLQVRSKRLRRHKLTIYRSDKDHEYFISASVETLPIVVLCGWMLARDAKADCWLEQYGTRPPAYFVPESKLEDMADLPEMAAVGHEPPDEGVSFDAPLPAEINGVSLEDTF